jgi:tRNA(Ile)-lysidine synthase
MDLLRAKSGSKILLDGEAMLQKSQGRLAITLQKDHTKGSVSDLRRLKIPGNTEIPNCEKWIESKILSAQRPKNLKSTPEMAFLDYDKISRPHIRTRKDGDRIRPYGMSGRKLISDVLIERKIPQFERNQIPIVVSGNKIAWIAGVMIADDFKVTESTKSILNLKLCER